MKLGVDGRVLYGKHQGTRTYLFNLLKEIDNVRSEIKFCLYGEDSANIDFKSIERIEPKTKRRIFSLLYDIGFAVKSNNIDVFYSQYMLPAYCPCKKVVAIHDILPVTHNEHFSRVFSYTRKHAFRMSALRADQIHTVSEYSRIAIIDHYNINEDKVHVIPNGVDVYNFDLLHNFDARLFLSNYIGESDFYLLTVGRVEPRKNYFKLIQVLSDLKSRHKKIKFKLIIVGHVECGLKELQELIYRKNLKDDVVFLANIDDVTLSKIYIGADLFVYPSLAEGFGIPPLEAMAAETAVVSSNATSMPEVLSNASLYFDPTDEEEMLYIIESVIFNVQLQNELIKKGKQRVKKFTWKSAANKYLSVVNKLK